MTIEELRELRRLLTKYELQIDPKEYEDERVIIQMANKVIHDDIKWREDND